MNGRMIVADDNELVRMATITIVQDLYPKLVIDDVADGMALVEKMMNGGKYAVVLTDYEMPRMDGLAAVREIRSFNAHIPIGVQTSKRIEREVAEVNAQYIQKGDPEKLYDFLRKCFGQ